MASRRQSEPASERAAEIFAKELREASGRVINHLAAQGGVPLRDVYRAHVWAVFDLLEMALRARRMYLGKMPPSPSAFPAQRIADRTEVFKEMMELIGEELVSTDPAHDYVVGLLKRRKGSAKA